MRTCLYIHSLFTHVLRENTKPPLFSPLTRGLQGHPNFLSSVATKGKNTEPNVTVSHYCLGMEVKSHTHTQSKVIWAKQKQPVCTHKRIIGNGERLPLGGHKAPVSASCPQRQGNCCINTHIQGGCQYFSHRFICLHSFLSSLVFNYFFLWTDSCFHWHFTYYTHKLLWKLSQPLLVFFQCVRVDEPVKCLPMRRDLLPEAPAAVQTCAGIIYSIHIGLYNRNWV